MTVTEEYDAIIIGGGPAGIVTGVTAKNQDKNKRILMINQEGKGVVPCGIPYIFYDLGDVGKNLMTPKPFVDCGGELHIGTVTNINLDLRQLEVDSGHSFTFDKLVFATGSKPLVPKFIKGIELENVELVPKSYSGISCLKKKTDAAKEIIILGSGFTAVELAEQLAKDAAKKVHLVFRSEHCLHRVFSPDYASMIDQLLKKTDIIMHAGCQIKEVYGQQGVAQGIILETGERIGADLIIAAMGYIANTTIAQEAGIPVNKYSQIIVDNYMRTNVADVFAVGDCAQTTSFMTGKTDNIMLASTATAEARVLGHNLYKLRIKRNFPGTLSVFATEINNTVFASAGVLEQDAEQSDISFVLGKFKDVDRHPGTFSDSSPAEIKLIVMPEDGQIIGGELAGSKSVAEIINTIALIIQKHVTVYELISFQIGSHPLLSTAPTKTLLIKAAENAISKISAYSET